MNLRGFFGVQSEVWHRAVFLGPCPRDLLHIYIYMYIYVCIYLFAFYTYLLILDRQIDRWIDRKREFCVDAYVT